MRKKLSIITAHKTAATFAFSCLLITFSLLLLSRYLHGFAEWYANTVDPVLQTTAAGIFSLWNRSFFEAMIISGSIIISSMTLTGIGLFLFSRTSAKKFLTVSLRFVVCMTAFLMLIYSLTCGVNYYRSGIGEVLNLPQRTASKENLIKLSLILADDLTEITKDPEWDYSLLEVKDQPYIQTEAVNSMKALGENEPSLAGSYPQAKPIYFSKTMSILGIEGIFSPFTMEANYNDDMTPFMIPYTICHELAHFKGYMKEDDAGFIAYLACRNSPSKIFQYSGIFHALIFSLNALKSEATPEEFNEIYSKLPSPVRIQLSYIKEQNQVNSTSFTSAAKSVNNLYLKANAQQQGIKSYGRIVDLLISDYAERIDKENLT